MRVLPLLLTLLPFAKAAVAPAPPAATRTDYFFRYVGGGALLDQQRLRGNISFDFFSPGAVNPPFNPADHFNRVSTNASVPSDEAILNVVPTHPHPPPVPGYYGLSDKEGIKDALRLIATYHPDTEGAGFQYTGWELRESNGPSGKVLLRYSGDADGEWRWIARREKVFDGALDKELDKWVPWYVRPSAANAQVLGDWEYERVDLELEVVKEGEISLAARA